MKYSISLLAVVAMVGLLWHPAYVSAQNKDIVALQRDIADVARKVDAIQKGQGERIDELTVMIKQSADATRGISADLHALEQNLEKSMQKSMAEQQRGVSEPMAAVRSGVDSVGQDMLAVRGDLTSLKTQIANIEKAVDDLGRAMRVLNAPAAVPPPNSSDAANALYTSAERDYLGGNNELALTEFRQYFELYPASVNAPRALLAAGKIYDRVMQYKEARDVFDMILERFPDSTTTPEAAYLKAEMLSKEGNTAAAATEFDNFAKKYPGDVMAGQATARAAQLRAAKGAKAGSKSKAKN